MEETMLQSRMKKSALISPEILKHLLAVGAAAKKAGVPERTLNLMYLRASQINGCTFCMDMHVKEAKMAGETDERLHTVAGFREAPWFSDAERAALALTESATRLSDREDAVPDAVWDQAAKYYEEAALSALVLNIAMINFWNRLNVTTRQIAGESWR
jgi:AhpD family alkylhydroperoxidase